MVLMASQAPKATQDLPESLAQRVLMVAMARLDCLENLVLRERMAQQEHMVILVSLVLMVTKV